MLPAAHHGEVCKVPSSYRAGTYLSMHDLILLHCHALCKIPRLINIKSFRHAHIVAQQLQGHDSQASHKVLIHSWDIHSEINMILRFILAEGGKTRNTTNKPNTTIKEARGWVFSCLVVFGLIVAQEGQKQIGDWVESGKVTRKSTITSNPHAT